MTSNEFQKPDRSSESLYLNRRGNSRINMRFAVRFQADPSRPLKLSRALMQDLSLKGMQILSPVLVEKRRPFPIWIPLGNDDVVQAEARMAWMSLEDSYGDSPYWVKCGLHLHFRNSGDREMLSRVLAEKAKTDRILKEQETSKVGFVF